MIRSKAILLSVFCTVLIWGMFLPVPISAYKTAEDSLRLLLPGSKGLDRIRILDRLCREIRQDEQVSMRYARQLLSVAKEIDEPEHLANAYGWIAEKFADREQTDSARTYLMQALRIAETKPKTAMWFLAHERLGRIELLDNNVESAIEEFLVVLPFWEQNNAKSNTSKEGKITLTPYEADGEMRVNVYLGQAYTQLGQYEVADKYFRKALLIAENAKKQDDIVEIRFQIASLTVLSKDYARALELYQSTLNYARKNKDEDLEAQVLYQFSVVYGRMKDYAKSLSYGEQALKILEKLFLPQRRCAAMLNLANVYLQTGQNESAERTAKETLALGQSIKAKTEILGAYRVLAECAEIKGDLASAYQYYQSYLQIKEATLDQAAMDKIHRLQQAYQNEKISRELALQEKERALAQSQTMEQAVWINSIILSILLLGVVAFVIFSRIRAHQKNIIILSEQNDKINLQNEDLFQAQEELNATLTQILEQKETLNDKNKKIEDSFQYARAIQHALLPLPNALYSVPNFILYRAQAVITGDFYWVADEKEDDVVYVSVVDCTGVGVSPALMSLAGYHQLNVGLKTHHREIEKVLVDCHKQLLQLLPTADEGPENGMEISLFKLQKCKLTYAGGRLPLMIYRKKDGKIDLLPASPVLLGHSSNPEFKVWTRELQAGDRVYVFTDGLSCLWEDGASIEKAIRHLQSFLTQNGNLSLVQQHQKLNHLLEARFGDQAVQDDLILIGVEVV